jgi:hypothetical protein
MGARRLVVLVALLAMATPLSSALAPGGPAERACEEANYYVSNQPCTHTAGHGSTVSCLVYLSPLNSGTHLGDNCLHV